MPTARHKLNSAAILGILVVAGVVAAVAQSWWLFFGLSAVLLGSAVHSGEIRLNRRIR